MEPRRHPKTRLWIPLGIACGILEVSQTTLRHWADQGLIRAFRTPGGHRRFSSEDVYALVGGTGRFSKGQAPQHLDEQVLRRIRRRLHGSKVASQRWYETFDEDGRARMRIFGRRLLTLASEYLSQRRRRPELLAEARLVGEEYGTEMARRGLSLSDVVQAFLFFRNSLLDATREALRGNNAGGKELDQTREQVTQLADEVLLATTHAYEGDGRRGLSGS